MVRIIPALPKVPRAKQLNRHIFLIILCSFLHSCNTDIKYHKQNQDSLSYSNLNLIRDTIKNPSNDSIQKLPIQLRPLQGTWVIERKLAPNGKELKFESNTILIILNNFVSKKIDSNAVLHDTLNELTYTDKCCNDFILKNHKNIGLYYVKKDSVKLTLAYNNFDGGREEFRRFIKKKN